MPAIRPYREKIFGPAPVSIRSTATPRRAS